MTVTALRDGAAWAGLVERVDSGDLTPPAERLDGLRHDVLGKLLVPLPWSPLQEIDLAAIPAGPIDHDPSVFMEDTVWPYEGLLEDYVERSGAHYADEMRRQREKGLSTLVVPAPSVSAISGRF